MMVLLGLFGVMIQLWQQVGGIAAKLTICLPISIGIVTTAGLIRLIMAIWMGK